MRLSRQPYLKWMFAIGVGLIIVGFVPIIVQATFYWKINAEANSSLIIGAISIALGELTLRMSNALS